MSETERRQTPAPPTPGGSLKRQQLWEQAQRRIYFGVVSVGMVIQAANWGLNLLRPQPDLVTTYTNPVFFVMCAWILVWLSARRPTETMYAVALTVCGGVILARAVATPLLGGPDMLTSLEDLYWLLVILTIVAFLMLNYRRSIAVTVAFYLTGVVVPWIMLALGGVPFGQAARLGQVQLLCAIILITLVSLAWYREHFVLERQALLLTEKAANTDALTGLNNRHALYPMLDTVLEGVEGGNPAAALLIDIDHFKGINDRLGHAAGDEVLRDVARVLTLHLRGTDVLGRWGGEEFLVALPGTGEAGALRVAERLRLAVADGATLPQQAVTISVGVTLMRRGDSLQACVSRADAALYLAKDAGRNRVELALTETDSAEDGLFSSEYQEGAPSPT